MSLRVREGISQMRTVNGPNYKEMTERRFLVIVVQKGGQK